MALNYNFYFWMETLRERDTMCAQSAQTSRGISIEGKVEVKYLRWKQLSTHVCEESHFSPAKVT